MAEGGIKVKEIGLDFFFSFFFMFFEKRETLELIKFLKLSVILVGYKIGPFSIFNLSYAVVESHAYTYI